MTETGKAFPFANLAASLEGDLFYDMSWRLLYATDASVFRELPAAVCRPAHVDDLKKILAFCKEHKLPIVPRTAGTSLAGQVVGHGLVVDFSRHMNKILELNPEEKWVRVQPGVILDDLNRFLEPHGLFFGPETSTSNRCMIGGMVANNSCGSHSLIYGSTRDHTLEVEALLTDGSLVTFGPTDKESFRQKCVGSKLENRIYRQLFEMLSDPSNKQAIRDHFPDPRIKRRNTGYALDLLMDTELFDGNEAFNLSRMLCGAEGTLALYTTIKLNLVPLPPPVKALVCVHVNSIEEALQANLAALRFDPVAVELIDNHILECTKTNIQQAKNRFFLKGDPGAILVVEFAFETKKQVVEQAAKMETYLRDNNLGYHYPLITGDDINKVWSLRKAGLGLLSNVPGDAKPVAVIEDAAVYVEHLPAFIKEVQALLHKLNLECVYYAHIGTGELHLRPVLNLKSRTDVERFHQVAEGMAQLVKKYKGSLSGEHGDGRLRGEFIPLVMGEACYTMFQQVKQTWDPDDLLNPGKITNTPSIKTSLRYTAGKPEKKLKTYFSFDQTMGFLRAVEQCNGSGDCRKPHQAGGVMCPSYQATLDEYDTTRGRANLLREFITNSTKKNPFDHKEIIDILNLCLSCKGCKAECPSNVDVGKYKAEVLQHYYDANGTPAGARITGAYATLNKLGSMTPGLYNWSVTNRYVSPIIKKMLGFAPERSLPKLQKETLRQWAAKHLNELNQKLNGSKQVYLFCDEFTNFNDTLAGIKTCLLLHHLGYRVLFTGHAESGRTQLSKGLLKKASRVVEQNVNILSALINENSPLIGVEPSAVLSFRDEYLLLTRGKQLEAATELAKHVYTVDEFIAGQFEEGQIDRTAFSDKPRIIYVHGHCHQKALSSVNASVKMLSVPQNNDVRQIDCGCCGMAGSFGYEKDKYALSMKIGELALFPAVRKAEPEAIIAASGTSCRHQILDGTGRHAFHPAEVLFDCLKHDNHQHQKQD